MKTSQTSKSISEERKALTHHEKLVHCDFGDTVFKECAPAGNRKQPFHQAAVTNLKYVFFVTAVAFDNKSEVLQYVILTFIDTDHSSHHQVVESIGMEIVGWLYARSCIERSSFGRCLL